MATMSTSPTDDDYRQALRVAERALMHASKWLQGEYAKGPEGPGAKVQILVNDARAEVSRILDVGRDEANEQIAT